MRRGKYEPSRSLGRCFTVCFIVAKDINKTGCVAIQVNSAGELVALKDRLEQTLDQTRIELVTISRPAAFGEYAPYTLAETPADFERLALAL